MNTDGIECSVTLTGLNPLPDRFEGEDEADGWSDSGYRPNISGSPQSSGQR
jgi:hypothetical protein